MMGRFVMIVRKSFATEIVCCLITSHIWWVLAWISLDSKLYFQRTEVQQQDGEQKEKQKKKRVRKKQNKKKADI